MEVTVRVLLVEDHEDVRRLLRLHIEGGPFDQRVVAEAATGPEALALEVDVDIHVVDHMMPTMTGLELLAALEQRGRARPTIVCSAFVTDELRTAAEALGVAYCIDKDEASRLPELIHALCSSATIE